MGLAVMPRQKPSAQNRRYRRCLLQRDPAHRKGAFALVRKKSILVIDDDKSILRTLTRILQKAGYEVDTAETGKEATARVEKCKYDLALVDVRLPDMDGTDLLINLKETLRDTVKIMITGFPSLEIGVKALDGGADAYLVKPVRPEELLMLIEEKLKS